MRITTQLLILSMFLCFTIVPSNKKKQKHKKRQQQTQQQLPEPGYDKHNYPPEWENKAFNDVIKSLEDQPSKNKLIFWCNAIREGIDNDFYGEKPGKMTARALKKLYFVNQNRNLRTTFTTYDTSTGMIQNVQQALQRHMQVYNVNELCDCLDSCIELGAPLEPQFIQKWQEQYTNALPNTNDTVHFSRSLHRLVKCNAQITPNYLDTWLTESTSKLKHFDAQALSNTILSLAKLQERNMLSMHKHNTSTWLAKWLNVSQSQLKDFTPQNLNNSIWGLVIFSEQKLLSDKHKATSQWLRQWLQQAGQNVHRFNEQDFTNSITSLEQLNDRKLLRNNHEEVFSWLEQWMHASHQKLAYFKSRHLVNSTGSLANFGKQPSTQWLKELHKRINTICHSMKNRDIIYIAYSLTKLEAATSDPNQKRHLGDIIQELTQNTDIHKLEDNAHKQQARWILYYHDNPAWQHVPQANCRESKSSLEDKVTRTLKRISRKLGESPRYHFYIKELDTTVDIAFPGSKSIIEIDGPCHFVHTHARYQNPKDMLKDALLQKAGWKVIRISHAAWEQCNNKEQYIQGLLKKHKLLRQQ